MNDTIRQIIRDEMQKQGLTQVQLARDLNLVQPNLARMLTGRSGEIPANWQKLFEALNMELTLQPKSSSSST